MKVGYEVTITPQSWYSFTESGLEYRVEAKRLSDAATLSRTFGWRWRARRFARSRRRLSKAFERQAKARPWDEVESYVLTWADGE
jgi:hypothetical protein